MHIENRVEREGLEMREMAEKVSSDKLNQFAWRKKASRSGIYRLYQGEAKGLLDEELLDDIGFTFYERCKQAHDARACMEKGEMLCHHCGGILKAGRASPSGSALVRGENGNTPVLCECGYAYTYREYRRSYMAANMPGNRAKPILEHFLQQWPKNKDAPEKMMLIDWLIHECHVTLMSGAKGKSACENLIEGTSKQISDLLAKLA